MTEPKKAPPLAAVPPPPSTKDLDAEDAPEFGDEGGGPPEEEAWDLFVAALIKACPPRAIGIADHESPSAYASRIAGYADALVAERLERYEEP